MKVKREYLMALRRLTNQPIAACHDALVESGGDLLAVIRRQRWSPHFGIFASDEELADVLAEYGVVFTPDVREPVILPDELVVADLTASGAAISDYFLICGMVGAVNAHGEVVACCDDDEDRAASTIAYLRRIGVPEYSSIREFEERGTGAPDAAPG